MILGIGIDSVQVKRFNNWVSIPLPQLLKVLSEEEINYCLRIPRLSAERFAVRFAAREAFFKAFCAMQKNTVPFLKICKSIKLDHSDNQAPVVHVEWEKIWMGSKKSQDSLFIHCSLTHTSDNAIAFIIIEGLS